MATRKKALAKGARSGPNIREDQRRTAAIKLRLRPERAEEIHALAAEFGVTASAVVDAAMGAALSDCDGVPPSVRARVLLREVLGLWGSPVGAKAAE